jgi:two-component system, sensor histidine kinase and response regulator
VFICVSAYGRDEVLEHSDAADFANILSKPVSQSRLRAALQSVQEAASPAPASVRAEHEQLTLASALEGKRLLLVEDDELNRKVAAAVLGRLGLEVISANSGEEALALLKSGDALFDCILMDIDLPEMDGVACTKVLKSLPDRGHIPIIALTAMASAHDRERCLEAGMVDFVGKPFDLPRLKQVLLQWTASAAPGTEQQEPAATAATGQAQTGNIPLEDETRGMMNELASLLAAGDPAALDCLARQEAPLQKLLGSTYRALRQAVNSYDFAAAHGFIAPYLSTTSTTSNPDSTRGAPA